MAKAKKSKDELKKRKTELQRKRRQLIKKNHEAYENEKEKERQRYHKRKTEGKIKAVKDLTPRQQRLKRKTWRDCSKNYREKIKRNEQAIIQHINENTPPSTPEPFQAQPQPGPSRASIRGRKKVRRDRAKAYRDLKKLRNRLGKTNARLNKYKTKYYRLK